MLLPQLLRLRLLTLVLVLALRVKLLQLLLILLLQPLLVLLKGLPGMSIQQPVPLQCLTMLPCY